MERLTLFAVMLLALAAPARAEPLRFAAELNALAQQDGVAPVDADGALFLGSSSIRLWDVRASFPGAKIVNHGFGGATVQDVLASYDLVVGGQKPGTIIVYVGENDLAAGRSAAEVSGDVTALLARLRADHPQARIGYLSIKYAPVRWSMRKTVTEANRLIAAQADATAGFDFIDVTAGLLALDQPNASYYGKDGLHLSSAGYAQWNRIVGPYLAAPR